MSRRLPFSYEFFGEDLYQIFLLGARSIAQHLHFSEPHYISNLNSIQTRRGRSSNTALAHEGHQRGPSSPGPIRC